MKPHKQKLIFLVSISLSFIVLFIFSLGFYVNQESSCEKKKVYLAQAVENKNLSKVYNYALQKDCGKNQKEALSFLLEKAQLSSAFGQHSLYQLMRIVFQEGQSETGLKALDQIFTLIFKVKAPGHLRAFFSLEWIALQWTPHTKKPEKNAGIHATNRIFQIALRQKNPAVKKMAVNSLEKISQSSINPETRVSATDHLFRLTTFLSRK